MADTPHPAERAELLRALYTFQFNQPQQSIDREEREQYAARLRHLCEKHDITIPDYLSGLHEGVKAHPLGGEQYAYTYEHPWQGPNPTAGDLPSRKDGRDLSDEGEEYGDKDDDDLEPDTFHEDLSKWERKLTRALKAHKHLETIPFSAPSIGNTTRRLIMKALPTITSAQALRELFAMVAADNE